MCFLINSKLSISLPFRLSFTIRLCRHIAINDRNRWTKKKWNSYFIYVYENEHESSHDRTMISVTTHIYFLDFIRQVCFLFRLLKYRFIIKNDVHWNRKKINLSHAQITYNSILATLKKYMNDFPPLTIRLGNMS